MYEYLKERDKIFTESGQRMFLSIRDNAYKLCRLAGCATMEKLTSGQTGDSWQMLACVDRLVELGELYEVKQTSHVPGQYRVFRLIDWG